MPGWDTARDGEQCGMPRFLPLISIPIIAFLALIILLVVDALT